MTRQTLASMVAVTAAATTSLLITTGSDAAVHKRVYALRATLAPVPHSLGAAHARGRFTGSLTITGATGTLSWTLAYSGLTGPATVSHIALGRSGTMLIPLCAPCHPGQHGRFNGRIGKHSLTLRAILAVHTYVSVQTARNSKGELRGYVHVTPVKAG